MFSSVVPFATSTYLNTNANPPVSTTEVIYETVRPAAQVPGDDTCGQPCLIGASEVQLFYWPVTTAPTNGSALVPAAATPYTLVSDGFTFTSPSVYVAYRGLEASAAYEPFGLPIGGKSHDVTVGYPPGAISTSHCNVQYTNTAQGYQPVNYTMLEFPPPNSAITDCAHVSGVQDVGGSYYNPSASNEATNPFFSIPGPLNWVDPLWSSCIPVTYGVFDPPRKLSKASDMVAPTPVPATTPAADSASPAAAVTPTIPPATAGGPDPGRVPGVQQPASALVPPVQEPVASSVPAAAFGPSATATIVANPLPADPAVASLAPVNPAPANSPPAESVASAVDTAPNTPALVANDPGTTLAPVVQTPAPIVETPSYNSVVMATPSPVVAAPSPAAVVNTPVVNQPVVNAPVANSPVNNVPAVNAPAVNSPVANAPVVNAPAANVPAANTPVANTPVNNAPAVNAPAANVPAVKMNNPVVVASPSPVVIAGNTAAPAANGGVVIASSTYAPGSQATVGGNVVSVGTNNVVQDGTTHNVPQQTELTPVLVGSNSIEAASGGGVVIASSTYQPGAQAQVAGTPVSVGPSNIIVGSSTHAIPTIVPAVTAAPTPTPVLVGGNSIANAPGGGVVIASSTYQPGVQAQISGTPISVGTDNIVVDNSMLALPKPPLATPILVAGQSIAKAANGGVVIASSTYMPGDTAQVAGTPISVGTDNVVVNSKAYALPTAPAPNAAQNAAQTPAPAPSPIPVLVGSQSIVKATGGGVVIGSSTLAPGAQATIQGHVVTAGTNNVIVDGNNFALPSTAGETLQQQAPAQQQQQQQQQQQTPAQIGGQSIVRASNGGLMIGTSTLAPGSQATISGTIVSAGSTNVALGSSTYALPSTAGALLQTPAPPQSTPVEFAGNTIVRASNGGIIIGSSTVAPGSQTTISNQVISAGSTNVAIDGSTYTLPTSAGAVLQIPASTPSNAPVLVAGQTIARASNGGLVVGSSTIAPGAEATIAGHVVSAASGGSTNIAIDGNNYAIPTSAGAVLETPAPNLPPISPQPIEAAITLANGAIISAGGSAAVVSGITCTVLPNDSGVVIGSKTISLPPASVLAATTTITITVASVTFVACATGFPIARITTSLSPGGPACTIEGTMVSLGQGALQVGSTIMPLPTIPPETFTVADQTITAAPTGFTIAPDTTVSPNGSAVTISGTVVSLGSAGLLIGTSTIPLDAAEFTVAAGDIVSGVEINSSATNGTGSGNGTLVGPYDNSTSLSTSYSPPMLSPSAPPLPSSTATTGKASRLGCDLWMLVMTGLIGWGIGVVVFAL